MNSELEYRKIEDKKYYVTMTDSFLSGWGMAENKTNKLVIGCDTFNEAVSVKRYALNRSEMKYVNIVYNKPRYKDEYYFVTYHDKTDYPFWFNQ
jgi:hypothetical protein